jgi:DNA polymerase III alpha subunit
VSYDDYAKRAVELGHKTLSCVEHGWQSSYWTAYETAKQYGLKFVFGAEAYWVLDGHENDRTNAHIVVLAKNENGRRAINKMLSYANKNYYYYKPRVDIELLLALPADDVIITTACVAFWLYPSVDEVVLKLHEKFGTNFFLEIQNHAVDKQRDINRHIKELSERHGIEMIAGLDSHFIHPAESVERDEFLASRGIRYDDEANWYMDYPDDAEVTRRFLEQGVFTRDEIDKAMANTDIVLTFDDLEFDADIKLPVLPSLRDKTQEERNDIYRNLVRGLWADYKRNVLGGVHNEAYERGVEDEIDVICATNMSDYFLIDYEIVRRGIEKGGMITKSGRGSGVGWFTNTLLGFSDVDRFMMPIKLYPERFISKTRILETKSLPDLDLNLGNPEVFAEAQEEVLGEGHSFPMIAFGTLRKKAAWKLYAKSQDIPFDVSNAVSEQLDKFDNAVKYSDEEEVKIEDYVHKKYLPLVDESKRYQGVISDKKKAPCAYLLYSGDIESEIGLIRCKSESTKKDFITTVMDGAVAEKYKYLKNDLLKVDVVLLIESIFRRAGVSPLNVRELLSIVEKDSAVWDIYGKGATLGVNQVEKDSTTKKVVRYMPKNLSELTAFIAAIRPAFQSMYQRFERQEDFSYGIRALDDLIRTPQFPYSYILYQEQTMNVLHYAGFPLDVCYQIIKDIAKKHPEKVLPLKQRFIDGFGARIMEDEGNLSSEAAEEMSQKVWRIIEDSTAYGFNSAHAVCMAIDSLYMAYLKVHYPYEFYETLLKLYTEKGDKTKVADLRREMKRFFGISAGLFRWGADNRDFTLDRENRMINPSMASVKNIGKKAASALFDLAQSGSCRSFYDVYDAIKSNGAINSKVLDILIKIGYFSRFASVRKLTRFVEMCNRFYNRKQLNIIDVPDEYAEIVEANATKSAKRYNNVNAPAILRAIWECALDTKDSVVDLAVNEIYYLGGTALTEESLTGYAVVTSLDMAFSPKITYYSLRLGTSHEAKIGKREFNALKPRVYDVIKIKNAKQKAKQIKTETGFAPVEGVSELWITDYSVVRRGLVLK